MPALPPDIPRIILFLKSVHLFRGLNDAQLEMIAAAVQTQAVEANQVIFTEGDRDERLFFIFNGRVRISRLERDYLDEPPTPHSLGVLSLGDYFGQEALEVNPTRLVTITALEPTMLLSLDQGAMARLLAKFPQLDERLELILRSFFLSLKVKLPWRQPDEAVYFIGRRHLVFLYTRVVVPLIALGVTVLPLLYLYFFVFNRMWTVLIASAVFLCATGGWILWNYLDWANDYFIITKRRICYQEKVLMMYDSRRESPLEAIQNTMIEIPRFGRVFRYGTISARTYIGSIDFNRIWQPEQMMAIIQEQKGRAIASQKRADLEVMRQYARKRTAPPPPPQAAAAKSGGTPSYQSGPLQKFLSNMLHMRYEKNGVIIFRTHWWILVKQVWLPTLLILILLAALIARLVGVYPVPSVAATAGIVLVGLLVVGVWWGYQYVDWDNDHFIVAGDQVVDVEKTPFGKEKKQVAPLKSVLAIDYERIGLAGLFLNFGTVTLSLGGTTVKLEYVYNPSDVQRELFELQAQKNLRDARMQAEAEWQRTADLILAFDEVNREQRSK